MKSARKGLERETAGRRLSPGAWERAEEPASYRETLRWGSVPWAWVEFCTAGGLPVAKPRRLKTLGNEEPTFLFCQQHDSAESTGGQDQILGGLTSQHLTRLRDDRGNYIGMAGQRSHAPLWDMSVKWPPRVPPNTYSIPAPLC